MLDIKFIRENQDQVKDAVRRKFLNFDVDNLLIIDDRRRELLGRVESIRAQKNEVSKLIPNLDPESKKIKISEMQALGDSQDQLQEELRKVEIEFQELMYQVPNIPAGDVPDGADDTYNKPVKFWHPKYGEYTPSDTEVADNITETSPVDHVEIMTSLDLVDFERGVNTSGFRGYYLKNEGVFLHYGVMQFALAKLRGAGFTVMATPNLVKDFALYGSGHFPGDREGIYQVSNAKDKTKDKEEIFLTGTSEPSLLAYFADTILEEKDLPKTVGGISQCYRSEIGSYGRDTKGVYRVHEFMKVEQVVICKADIEESEAWHKKILGISESILQDLGIPYRIVANSAGDMGAGKYRMFDIESWMPGRGKYGETHSASNLTDWQTRRLNIRYRDSEGKLKHAFALNNTAIASPRILIAIIENYLQSDGSIKVPSVLVPYVGKEIISKNAI